MFERDIRRARELLTEGIRLKRGPGKQLENVNSLLRVMWEAASQTNPPNILKTAEIGDGILSEFIDKYKRYMDILSEGCCISVNSSVSGKLEDILLLSRQFNGIPDPKREVQTRQEETREAKSGDVKASSPSPKERIYVFVDVPNLTRSEFVNIHRFNWFMLKLLIDNESKNGGNSVMEKMFAYLYISEKIRKVDDWMPYKCLKKAGFEPIRNNDSGDIPMGIDIASLETYTYRPGDQITVVIVTGDKNFGYPLEEKLAPKLRKEGVKLKKIIMCWENHVGKLKETADKIVFLDSYLPFLDHMAYMQKEGVA